MQLLSLKNELLDIFHNNLRETTLQIINAPLSREEKAKRVNILVHRQKAELQLRVSALKGVDQANFSLVLQYCSSVANLEYRHKVWPYEYMAFSRRIGELWELFCKAAWDYPSRNAVCRIETPTFNSVRQTLLSRITENVGDHENKEELLKDISALFEIVGDINMREDEVFSVDGIPHIIDFKSGFGSNEKGNMLRLLAVGKAYKIWNHDTRLFLLVRQETNNNYLQVLQRAGLWDVHTASDAYARISEFTGADISFIRNHVINWRAITESCVLPGGPSSLFL